MSQENLFDEISEAIVNLDKEKGLGVTLDSLNPDEVLSALKGHGFWQTLSAEKQTAVEDKIRNGLGTVGDLIDEMLEPDTSGGMGGVSPPMDIEETP